MDSTEKKAVHLSGQLQTLSPALYQNYRQTTSIIRFALQKYQNRFPSISDYSINSSVDTVDICEQLLGEEGIAGLSAAECYVLLMACYLQFLGFGISSAEYHRAMLTIAGAEPAAPAQKAEPAAPAPITEPAAPAPITEPGPGEAEAGETENELRSGIIRHQHQLSIYMIRKLAGVIEFPAEEYQEAVCGLVGAAGNKKKVLDRADYPDRVLPDGSRIREYGLAAVLQTATALDYLINRNDALSENMLSELNYHEVLEFAGHAGVAYLAYEGDAILVEMKGSDTVTELIRFYTDPIGRMLEAYSSRPESAGSASENNSRPESAGHASENSSRPESAGHASENSSRPESDIRIRYRKLMLCDREPDQNKSFLNREIEQNWNDEDRACFARFTDDEKKFYLRYLSAEFSITRCLREYTERKGARLEALEHRVKTPGSIYSKLHMRTSERALENLGDTVRYTVIFTPETYTEHTLEILRELSACGWKIYDLWNAWMSRNVPYNGINSNLITADGYKAEVQFHTRESYDVKMSREDHELYERRRLLEKDSPEYMEILQKQFGLYSGMTVPAGVEQIEDIGQ